MKSPQEKASRKIAARARIEQSRGAARPKRQYSHLEVFFIRHRPRGSGDYPRPKYEVQTVDESLRATEVAQFGDETESLSIGAGKVPALVLTAAKSLPEGRMELVNSQGEIIGPNEVVG